MSYETLHRINKRATPEKMLLYTHALLLYKIYNDETSTMSWVEMNFPQNFNARLMKFIVHTAYNYKVGNNLPESLFSGVLKRT